MNALIQASRFTPQEVRMPVLRKFFRQRRRNDEQTEPGERSRAERDGELAAARAHD